MHKRFTNATTLIAVSTISTWAMPVFAHDGHGLAGSHWHATDAFAFLGLVCVVAVSIWLARRGK